ncbi:ABC transporter permease [Paenibacillaceae bacterium]|nr:ABC transporter permease [Paenibacillaceae bacterium]
MKAAWTLCLSQLGKNKLQHAFVVLLILLSALLIGSAALIIANTGNLFADRHEQAQGSHQILSLERGLHDPQTVHDWWEAQSGVKVSKLLRYRMLSGISYQEQDIPNLYFLMMDTPTLPLGVDELIAAQGHMEASPAAGTVWIPTSLAYPYGIAPGDTVSFKLGSELLPLQVAAVVVDLPYGAPFTNTARIWMNTSDYAAAFASLPGNDYYTVGLRFADYNNTLGYWETFEERFGTPFLESKKEFEEIASFYLIIGKLVGFVMIVLGIVMMLIALFTIGFTISDSILANYRTIGVLKSLGLRSSEIIGIYAFQYGLLSVVAIIPGLALSRLLSQAIIDSTVSSLKTAGTALNLHGIGLIAMIGLLLFLLVGACVTWYANRARSIQPAQAIKYGMSEHASGKLTTGLAPGTRWLGFGSLPVTSVIGLKSLLGNKRGAALMLVLAIAASSVLVFGFVLLNSITNIQQTPAKWGYDAAHISGSVYNKPAFSQTEFDEILRSDSRVKDFGWLASLTGIAAADDSPGSSPSLIQPMSISLSALDGNYDQLGFETLKGSNPLHKNEIALGVNVAGRFGKQLGDTIELYIEGKRQTFTITGIYQAISNMSYSARITMDAIRTVLPEYNDMESCFINVLDISQASAVAHELNERFKDSATVVTQQVLLDSLFKEATTVLIYPMSLIGLLFTIVTFIIIYLTCRINIRKESKTYGIYKSLGMTSSRIRLSIASGIAGLFAIGALFGILTGVYALPLLLENVLANYGIVHVPLVLHWGAIIAVSCISIAAAALGSWASSRAIRQLSPRVLVVE